MTTGLVVPLIVRSPVTRRVSSSTGVTSVETKVISGLFSMSRKSLLRRWPSRCSLRVLMLSVLIVTWILDWLEVVAVDLGAGVELVELAADLGDHGVTGDEADGGVGRVDGVGAGRELGGGGGAHGVSSSGNLNYQLLCSSNLKCQLFVPGTLLATRR